MAVMYGKTKRFKLNETFQTSKGPIMFLEYIETEEDQPKVKFVNLGTNNIEIDYYGIVYYKVIKQHKKLRLPPPESVKYEYNIDYSRKLKFGVEIEAFVHSKVALIQMLELNGIKIDTPINDHDVVTGWKIVDDGSLQGSSKYEAVEIVSPPSLNFDELKIVCNVLKALDAKINTTCGLHVHHDINDLNVRQIKNVYDFYYKYEDTINKMHKKNRDESMYCRSVRDIIDIVRICKTKDDLLRHVARNDRHSHTDDARYYKVNIRSFIHYGTIEFRHAGGTIQFNEITDWIIFTHKIIECAINNDTIEDAEPPFSESVVERYEEMINELGIYWLTDVAKRLLKRAQRRRLG